ncbi:MAG: CIA30 family protein [Treponema sp.]|nr:CIA30 family protein [Treponema sp.]
MRKLFICTFLIFSLLPLFAAGENTAVPVEASTEVNEQYETFSWQPVAKANQYEVTIQRFDNSINDWVDYKAVKTKKLSLEVLFTPGEYRVSIATYNVLGRKGKSTEWVKFKILEEHIPYLNDRFLAKNADWNAPVLFLDRNGTGALDTTGTIFPEQDYGNNTILVKGRNIFSPRTEFYLVPKDNGPQDARGYVNYCEERKEQKLQILYRDSSVFSVVVSYDPSLLYSGYYALEVRNGGDNKDSIDILVLDNSEKKIEPNNGFEIDSHYNVNSFTINSNTSMGGVYKLSVDGKGFNSNTQFYLEPASGSVKYPFESQVARSQVELEVTGNFIKGASTAQITLDCPVEKLRAGYYNLVAKNWDNTVCKFVCLVKKPFEHDYTKDVSLVKTKYNKKTGIVDVTLKDVKLTQDKTYTLISQYNEEIDSNSSIPLSLMASGKKLVGTIPTNLLSIAKYALLIEDEYSFDVIYCDMDNRLKLSMEKMSDSVVEKTFLRPAGKSAKVSLDVGENGIIEFTDNEIEMIKHMPPLFSNLTFDLTFEKNMTMVVDIDLDLLNFGWASLAANTRYRVLGDEGQLALAGIFRLSIPNMYFAPYIGIGIGENLALPQTSISGFNDILPIFTNKDEVYAVAQAGVSLLTVIDIRYNLELRNLFGERYFADSLSFGFTFPLRSYKFKRKVLTRSATITKAGHIQAEDFIEPTINVDDVTVKDNNSIGGFEGYNNLKNVSIDYTVEVVEENAFRDCQKLESVTFEFINDMEHSLVIKHGAFAGDTQIDSILLPPRLTEVQSGAFDGWTNGQIIVLAWDKNDTTPRNLVGLDSCNATIIYKNEEVYKGNYKTPLDDAHNWVPLNHLNISNVSVYKDNNYSLGIRVSGLGLRWYRSELDTWINQESPAAVVNYLQSGDKISFKVQGDGNKYDFIITTEEGGYFYYRFKTEKDKVTEVEIPYKKLQKYSYSNVKKLDKDRIKMCCILPMCKDEFNNASFFEFEVSSK